MSHKQRIFNMLAKTSKPTQLSRKVNFALSDDISDAALKSESLNMNAYELYNNISELQEMVARQMSDFESMQREAQSMLDDIEAKWSQYEKAAQDLGVDAWETPSANKYEDAQANLQWVIQPS